MHVNVTLRPATAADAGFAYRVRETTMREYVIATWGVWNEDAARAQVGEDARSLQSRIIEVDGRGAGLLRVDVLPTHIHLDQIFLLPEFQGKGVGTMLLEQVMLQAATLHLPLRLWVLRVNPARNLYERLGFTVLDQTPASLFLEYPP
jgi:GNAT superfamily N-acetyltransferase